MEWALAGLAEIRHDLGERYPECADDLTPQIAFGLRMAEQMYDLKARVRIEATRTAMNETMADLFDQVDFVFTPTESPMSPSARRVRSRPCSTASRPGRATTAR